MNTNESVVIKHGSSVVEHDDGIGLDQAKIDFHVRQHDRLRRRGFSTSEVASGAVVEGKEYVLELGKDLDDFDDNELAMHGTARQLRHWEDAARPHDMSIGQVLATHQEIDDSSAGKQIIKRILSVTRRGGLVVVNENNAAADDEMEEYEDGEKAKMHGEDDAEADNDWLAAHLAIAVGAKTLALLTNVDGLKIKGKLVREIRVYDIAEMLTYCQGSSNSGTGGMNSKLRATQRAAEAGIDVVIGNAFTDIRHLVDGDAGTRVVQ